MTGLQRLLAALVLAILGSPGAAFAQLKEENSPPYLIDPSHPWHALGAALFIRTDSDGSAFSRAQLDLLYWQNTKYLLSGPSHEAALRVMDDFIRTRAEARVRDSLQRAWLQRDTWALFDWVASAPAPQRAELMRRMALIIRSLALTPEEIHALPATASIADHGAWLVIGSDFDTPTAFEHLKAFGGRSVFLVLARFPAGPTEARAYLKALRDSPRPSVPPKASQTFGRLHPEVPQFPVGTEWALVRRLCLINTLGEIQVSPLIESIQLRRYGKKAQEFSKFEMQFERRGALRRLSASDVDFQHVHFRGMGIDPFELQHPGRTLEAMRKPTLRTCGTCHAEPGVASVLSYNNYFSGTSPYPAPLQSSDLAEEAAKTLRWKYARHEWQAFKRQ